MNRRILIADPDAGLQQQWKQLLNNLFGWEVETTSEGLDCVKMLDAFQPDVLVLDLDLLWGGAAGVLSHLRESSSTRPVPVVLTANGDQSDRFTPFAGAPVVYCLSKPAVPQKFLESVLAAASYGLCAPVKGNGCPAHPDPVCS
jgi:CheY-like chemotaxis protein